MNQLPQIIQGGMGAAVSNWRLAKAVSWLGQLGVVAGTALDEIMSRRLQDGDVEGHVRRALEHFPFPQIATKILDAYFIPGGRDSAAPYKRTPCPCPREQCPGTGIVHRGQFCRSLPCPRRPLQSRRHQFPRKDPDAPLAVAVWRHARRRRRGDRRRGHPHGISGGHRRSCPASAGHLSPECRRNPLDEPVLMDLDPADVPGTRPNPSGVGAPHLSSHRVLQHAWPPC